MCSAGRSYVLLILFAAAVVAAAGCSDSSGGRMGVSGTVKLVGEPVEDGTIQFAPLEEANKESKTGAQIRKGEFKIDRKQGLKPGKYHIAISSGDPNLSLATLPEDTAPGPSKRNPIAVDRVPDDWSLHSKHEVEVTSSGPNKFDFDIPTYNPEYLKKKKK